VLCLSTTSTATAPATTTVEPTATAPEPAATTTAAGKAPITIRPGTIATLVDTSEGPWVAAASWHTPISDTVTSRHGIALTHPVGAPLGWRPAALLTKFRLTRLAGGAGCTCGAALTGPASATLAGHTRYALTALAGAVGATLPRIGLVEPLLRLAHCRAGGRTRPSAALIPVGDVAIGVRHAPAVSRIMHPVVTVADIYSIEVVAADEIVIDHDIVAASPSASPSPSTPTAAA